MLRDRILFSHLPPKQVKQNPLGQLFATRKRTANWQLEYELTDFVRMLALLVHNGVPILVAFAWLGPRTLGQLGPILAELNRELELGASLAEGLDLLADAVGGEAAAELAQKVRVSLERGTPLADQLNQLARSSQAASAARLVRQAGSNETKMLIPTIFVILPVTVLFAVYPSLSLLQTNL